MQSRSLYKLFRSTAKHKHRLQITILGIKSTETKGELQVNGYQKAITIFSDTC